MTDNELLTSINDEIIAIRGVLVDETGSGTMNFLGMDANGFYILIVIIVFLILFKGR